jgi:hypothetical protein
MKNSLTFENIKDILDKHFGAPFLSEDMVNSKVIDGESGKSLSIEIGRRTIVIDEDGEVVDTLTAMN